VAKVGVDLAPNLKVNEIGLKNYSLLKKQQIKID
jgi:hypothetical protein